MTLHDDTTSANHEGREEHEGTGATKAAGDGQKGRA
jgi:hypothetical protein